MTGLHGVGGMALGGRGALYRGWQDVPSLSTPLVVSTPTKNSGVVASNFSEFRKCLESLPSCPPAPRPPPQRGIQLVGEAQESAF